jgi:hypothetical protein
LRLPHYFGISWEVLFQISLVFFGTDDSTKSEYHGDVPPEFCRWDAAELSLSLVGAY